MTAENPHILVVGNEKGGAGKTTSAMHLIASLLSLGFSVASIDVDSRQLSLTHYIENRRKTLNNKQPNLLMPHHIAISPATQEEETESFLQAINQTKTYDFVVVDTPGSDSFLSRLVHSYADTIITPINDSFVDLDVLARVEGDQLRIERPGIYSAMIWEQKMQRAKRDQGSINWIVMRNRLSTIDAKNKRYMEEVLTKLAQRIGFMHAPGFGERVIFRELFLRGLTLLDLQDQNSSIAMNMSHVAARQELRQFLKSLNIKAISDAMDGTANGASNRQEAVQQEEVLEEMAS